MAPKLNTFDDQSEILHDDWHFVVQSLNSNNTGSIDSDDASLTKQKVSTCQVVSIILSSFTMFSAIAVLCLLLSNSLTENEIMKIKIKDLQNELLNTQTDLFISHRTNEGLKDSLLDLQDQVQSQKSVLKINTAKLSEMDRLLKEAVGMRLEMQITLASSLMASESLKQNCIKEKGELIQMLRISTLTDTEYDHSKDVEDDEIRLGIQGIKDYTSEQDTDVMVWGSWWLSRLCKRDNLHGAIVRAGGLSFLFSVFERYPEEKTEYERLVRTLARNSIDLLLNLKSPHFSEKHSVVLVDTNPEHSQRHNLDHFFASYVFEPTYMLRDWLNTIRGDLYSYSLMNGFARYVLEPIYMLGKWLYSSVEHIWNTFLAWFRWL